MTLAAVRACRAQSSLRKIQHSWHRWAWLRFNPQKKSSWKIEVAATAELAKIPSSTETLPGLLHRLHQPELRYDTSQPWTSRRLPVVTGQRSVVSKPAITNAATPTLQSISQFSLKLGSPSGRRTETLAIAPATHSR